MNAHDPTAGTKFLLRIEHLTGNTAVLSRLIGEIWEPVAIIFPIRGARFENQFAWLILYSSQTGQADCLDDAITAAAAALGGVL